MNQDEPYSSEESPGPRQRVTLPLARPVVTYILLGLIALTFLAETVLGGSTRTSVLVYLGAQVNSLVANGQYWRLLAAMFLHIGPMHLLFNGWALFSLGRDVESLYGSVRFLLVYLLSGLFGGLPNCLLAANYPSAGASGAIFGLIGAQIAYFFRNRQLFGSLSKQQLSNLAGLVAINLVFGFTVPGINNFAHIGGLVAGITVGMGLSPHYKVQFDGLMPAPRLLNRTPMVLQIAAVMLAAALLLAGIYGGTARWAGTAGAGAFSPGTAPAQVVCRYGSWSPAEVMHETATAPSRAALSDRRHVVSGGQF